MICADLISPSRSCASLAVVNAVAVRPRSVTLTESKLPEMAPSARFVSALTNTEKSES